MALISVDELGQRIDAGDRHLRVVDLRWYLLKPGEGRARYAEGHVPGAIHLDLDTDLADPNGLGSPGRHPLPAPYAFRRRLESAGIGSEHFVAVYDDAGGTIAARLWWMLDNLDHRGGQAVLNGGIGAWTAAGRPLEQPEPKYEPAKLRLGDAWTNVIERTDVAARMDEFTVLDGRAADRYRGEVEPIDPAAGHIPTALSAPTAGNLTPEGRFRTPEELRERFATLANGRPVVTYCGSGVTACHNSLAMRISGLPDPILYVGSFSDWSRSGMPVVAGAESVAGAQRRDQ